MDQREVLSKCMAEYERLVALVSGGGNIGAINSWEECEESTSNLLIELESSLENLPPTDDFKSMKKKLFDLNTRARREVASAEQMQRENR
ncbi:hypothetical protein [Rhodoferax bucti]|uniref:hypothetical protein n=1 Tax=Rhodoferax bucti TaxID=2576305 RepID=UPI0011086EB3|nr:hypothetical protein [Rhodoferax bucti]